SPAADARRTGKCGSQRGSAADLVARRSRERPGDERTGRAGVRATLSGRWSRLVDHGPLVHPERTAGGRDGALRRGPETADGGGPGNASPRNLDLSGGRGVQRSRGQDGGGFRTLAPYPVRYRIRTR